MKYILMCGGNYNEFEIPKQLLKINGETLVERTIRLLKENGITDIAISTSNPMFDYINVEKLRHNNEYVHDTDGKGQPVGCWLNAYYPTDEPACYLHGDVYFSEDAIKKIINADFKDTLFLCTCDWSDKRFVKSPKNFKGREPFGYIVKNQNVFRNAINDLLRMTENGEFKDGIKPFSWHLYRYLNGLDLCKNTKKYTEINNIFNEDGDYLVINDVTTDIDSMKDIKVLEEWLRK